MDEEIRLKALEKIKKLNEEKRYLINYISILWKIKT